MDRIESESSVSTLGSAKSVSFGDVCVSYHSQILGDNPSVSSGLPVTLDWKSVHQTVQSMEEYENTIEHRNPPLILPAGKREALLRHAGHSRESFRKCQQELLDLHNLSRRKQSSWKRFFQRRKDC